MEKNSGRGRAARARAAAIVVLALGGAPAALAALTSSAAPKRSSAASVPSTPSPEAVLRTWTSRPRRIARLLIEKYGEPGRYGPTALVWDRAGPWKRTVVYRDAWPRLPGMGKEEYLEQTIGYSVPAEKTAALKRFDPAIEIDRAGAELSARADSEQKNFLALNLAEEIVLGKRGVDEARAFYGEVLRLSESGKSSGYLGGLLFSGESDKHFTDGSQGLDRGGGAVFH
ncbi:MAG: hypothetical protein ACHQ49_07590 [Elusimicrobiota bacterium]